MDDRTGNNPRRGYAATGETSGHLRAESWLYIPTQDEKTFALLAHVLGIFRVLLRRWYFSW